MTTPAIPGSAAVANPAAIKALQDLVIAVNANTQAVKAVSISPQVTVSAGKQVVFTNSLTFSGTDGKTETFNNSLTFDGTDGTTMTFPSTNASVARTDAGQTFTGTQAFGALTATTVNGLTISATTGTFTLTNAKTLTVDNSLELAGTDSTKMTFPGTNDTIPGLAQTNAFTNTNTITKAAAESLTLRSGSTGAGNFARMSIGRTASDLTVTVATQATDIYTGANTGAAGDAAIDNHSGGGSIWVTPKLSAMFVLQSGQALNVVSSGGGGVFQAAAAGGILFPAISTTASAANAFLDNAANNNLLRSTSSAAYKPVQENIEPTRVDAFFAVARPVWHRSNASADRKDWSWYSFIAEEVATIDPRLAQYAKRGMLGTSDPRFVNGSDELVPDGLNINGILAMAIAEIKNLRDRLKAAGIA